MKIIKDYPRYYELFKNPPDIPYDAVQNDWEFKQLLEEYKTLNPSRILEIGTDYGGSLYWWIKLAAPNSKVIALDLVGTYYGHQVPETQIAKWYQWAKDRGDIEFLRMEADSHAQSSLDKIKEEMPEIDFLFIDGDHTYQGVKKDFEMYAPLVRPGGLVVFHDICIHTINAICEVHRFWTEIRRSGYKVRELYSNSNQGQFGIGIVYSE